MGNSTKAAPPAAGSGWRLALTFLAVLGGINLLYYAEKKLALGIWDEPYTRAVAWSAAQVAAWVLPYPVAVSGTAIVAEDRYTLFIASGCNGLEALFLMLAGVVAWPASWARRWRGLALYLPLLYLLNLLRVVGLVHVARTYPAYLDVVHGQVAQGILIVFVLFFWAHYLRGTAR